METVRAKIISVGKYTDDIYEMWIDAPGVVHTAVPGQFISLYVSDEAHLLPRPISICEIDKGRGAIRLVYRVAGYGTHRFSKLTPGHSIRIMGALGKGFPIDEYKNSKNIILIGGGIGIPPMLCVGKMIHKAYPDIHITSVMGYRDKHLFLSDELSELSDDLIIATDDGSVGVKGTVIDALNDKDISADVIFTCGPTPMLASVKVWGEDRQIPTYLSLEERMACGIGACLGCVCETVDIDEHSKVNNARVCKDGPVFISTKVNI